MAFHRACGVAITAYDEQSNRVNGSNFYVSHFIVLQILKTIRYLKFDVDLIDLCVCVCFIVSLTRCMIKTVEFLNGFVDLMNLGVRLDSSETFSSMKALKLEIERSGEGWCKWPE